MEYYNRSDLNCIAVLILLAAHGLLFQKIWRSQSCPGISQKSQMLYALVLTARVLYTFQGTRFFQIRFYLYFYSGILALLISYGINFLVHRYYKTTSHDEKQHDDCKMWLLLIICSLLTVLVDNQKIFWSYSLYFETVAMIPQICFIQNAKSAEKYVLTYMILVTLARTLNVIDELMKQLFNYYQFDNTNMATGIIQVAIFCDFLIRFVREKGNENLDNVTVASVTPNSNDLSQTNNTRLASNLKDVVLLSPSMLNEKNQKDNGPILPIVHQETKINSDTTRSKY